MNASPNVAELHPSSEQRGRLHRRSRFFFALPGSLWLWEIRCQSAREFGPGCGQARMEVEGALGEGALLPLLQNPDLLQGSGGDHELHLALVLKILRGEHNS
jgi:hypothetical protein